VWLAFPEAITDPALLATYEALMNPEERCKQRRLHFERDRHCSLVTRALVRTTLSRYAGVPPESWVFKVNDYGRPDLAPGQCEADLRFNLSHTHGLVACAVTLGREVGVDVENVQRPGETVTIADRYFSPTEVRALRALPDAMRRDRFFEYWTLKEAYIKARGMGLALPLDQFSFLLDGRATIGIAFSGGIADDPAAWQFELFRPTPAHRLAVAVRRGSGGKLAIRVTPTVPRR
jgi:4'-phosphopantetheinyl transferase